MNRTLVRAALLLACVTALAGLPASAQTDAGTPASAGKTRVTWYGHAAFRIVTPTGRVLLVDPWINNPLNSTRAKGDIAELTKKVDLILVSHGHFDHVGDAVEIAKATKARLVTTFDQAQAYARYLGFPADQFGFDSVGNVGGSVSFFGGEVTITFVNAVHGSTLTAKEGGKDVGYPAGNPVGFLIAIRGGPTLYHTGDTAAAADMQMLRAAKVTLMLACIGDHFTMGPEGAAEATALVQPQKVAPMHYASFPVLTGTPAEFAAALKAKDLLLRYQPLQLHDSLEL